MVNMELFLTPGHKGSTQGPYSWMYVSWYIEEVRIE
jgi:hypothetical protein